MATAGQIRPKIDALKKKIAERAAGLTPERRRSATKRLKRLQRRRRVLLRLEARRKETAGKGKGAAPAEGAAASTPAAS